MPNQRTARKSRRQIVLHQLEDRVLFSATPAGELLLDPAHPDAHHFGPPVEAHDEAISELPTVNEYVFIDAGVSEAAELKRLLEAHGDAHHREFVHLTSDRDGLKQIAEFLADKHSVQAVHLISHGEPGTLQLGDSRFTASDLPNYAAELNQIRSSLAQGADFLIYGCDLAADERGLRLLQDLQSSTGADVAASTDFTGSKHLGGDWDLEVRTGQIEAATIRAASWSGVLGGPADQTWVLGNAGTKIDFTSGAPVVSDTLATEFPDGFAAWSDPGTGELVLFTNGRNVWNGQSERILLNGTNLGGSTNNSQPVAVAPIPGVRDQFYVFTITRSVGEALLYYSTVDMSDSSNGSVIDKRISLGTTQEGVDVIPHANGDDYWLLTYNTTGGDVSIDARHFDASGIVQTVTSSTALTHTGGYINSFIVHSEDYTQLLLGQMLEGELATATFDPATGQLSNHNLRLTQQDVGYGGAFSPDGSKFYYTLGSGGTNGRPYQYDLTTDAITQLSTESGHGSPGLAADGKIYYTRPNAATMSVVNSPDLAGAASSFSFQGLDLTAGGTFPAARANNGVFNTVAVQDSFANAPLISLDADSHFHGRILYIPVESTDAVALADTDAFVSDTDSSEFVSFEIRAAGVVDGNAELLQIGGRTFALGTSSTQLTDLIGSTVFQVTYDAITQTFTLTDNGGGNMLRADVQSLLGTVSYQHTDAVNRSFTQRTVKFVVNDGQFQSNAATAFLPIGFQEVDTEDNGTTQSNPRIAGLDNGGYVAIWDSFLNDGSNGGVSAQLFDSLGNKVGTNFIVNEFTDNNQRFSNVTGVDGGGFAVAFTSATDSDSDPSTDAATLRIFDATGTPITGDLTINTYTFGQQFRPDVALLGDGSLVVVWQSFGQDGDGMGVYGQRVSATGTKIGSEFRISSTSLNDQDDAVVTGLSDGGFVVGWEDIRADITPDGNVSRGLFAQRYDSAGNRVGQQIQLGAFRTGSQSDLTLIGLQEGFLAAWRGPGPGSETLARTFFRRFDAQGVALGEEQLVGVNFNSSLPYGVTDLPDGGFYIVWENPNVDGILGQRYNANGDRVGDEVVLESDPTGSFENPDVATLSSGNVVLISINRSDKIVAREIAVGVPQVSIANLATNSQALNLVRYTTFGSPIYVDHGQDASLDDFGSTTLTQFRVTARHDGEASATTSDLITLENQGLGPGQVALVGTDVLFEGVSIGAIDDPAASDGFVISFATAPTQAAVEALLRSTVFQTPSTTAVDAARHVQFELIDAAGTIASEEVTIAVSPQDHEFIANASLPGLQENLDVTKLANGNYLIVWEDFLADVDQAATQGRVYNSDGIPITETFFLGTLQRDQDQRGVRVAALDTGGFVAAFQTTTNQDTDDDGYAIAVQRFDDTGNLIGEEIQVSQTETGEQIQPDVTGLPGGAFAVVWQGQTPADTIGVALRVFDNSGTPTTNEIAVNATTIGAQSDPRIASLATGDMVVTWQESNGSVSYRRFDIAGNPLDAADRTANTGTGQQARPDVVAYASGFAIAWQGDGPGDADGIFLRRFDNSGNGLGPEQRVNTETVGVQERVRLTATEHLIGVSWSGESSADSSGIYFRVFGQAGAAVSEQTRVNTTTTGVQRFGAVLPGAAFDQFFAAWEAEDGTDNFRITTRNLSVPIQGVVELDANDSSGVTGSDYATSFMQGDTPVTLADNDAILIPVNNAQYSSLTLSISGLADAGQEFLHLGGQVFDLSVDVVVPQTVTVQTVDYEVTYASGAGLWSVVKVGGADMSQAEIEAVVHDLRYSNTAAPPTEATRAFQWSAVESGVTTASSTTSLSVWALNASPIISVDATTPYTQGSAAVVIDSAIGLSDADDTSLEGAVVTVSNIDTARDLLSLNAAATAAASTAGIAVAPYNIVNGQLRLSGTASLAEYQLVLEGVQFYSLSPTAGDRTISFIVNDGSSDSVPGNATIPFTVDTIPPPTPTQPLDMLAASDTGISDTDNNTQTVSPDFVIPAGTGTPGDTVTIYVDGQILGTTTVLGDGGAAYTPPAFADGTYQLSYSLTDVVGNESGLAPAISVVIDTQNSSGTLFVTDENFNTSTPRIRGASQSAPGEYLEIEVNGITYPLPAGGTFWAFEVPAEDALPDGDYPVTVTRYDLAGNAQQATGQISIDTVPPVIPTVDPQTSASSSPTITGTATLGVGESMTVEVDGVVYLHTGPFLNVSGGTWTLNVVADIDPDGTYEVIAIVTDQAGNQSTDTTVAELVIDTVEPSPPVVTALDTNDTTPTIAGTAFLEPGEFLEVTVNGVTYSQLSGDISLVGEDWTLVIPDPNALAEGRYDVMAVSSDGAGNSTGDATTDELGIDLTPPAIPTVDSLTTADATPAITGTAILGSGESLQITVDGRSYALGSGLSIVGTVWTLQIPNLFSFDTSGTYDVLAEVTDAAGNVSTDTTVGELIMDLVDAPTVNALATSDTTPAITGTAALLAGETLTVQVNGVTYTVGDGNLGMTGSTWTLTIPTGSELADGTYEVLARVTDVDGNTAVDPTSNELLIDTVAPAVPTVNSLSTNDTTPLLTGSATVGPNESLTITVDGFTYSLADPELSQSGNNWSLQIASGRELTLNGPYEVEAIVTDLAGNQSVDATVGELILDTLAPNAPTVDTLVTSDTTPAITGSANLAVDETLSVQVDGSTYVLGDGNLSLSGSTWTLTLPGASALTDGTYEVLATASDSAGNATPDTTSNELVIDTIAPLTPTIDPLTSNSATPLITGTATLDPGDRLTVEIDGSLYDDSQPHLTIAGNVWSLQIPNFNPILADGVYDVIAIATDLAGNASADITIGEFTKDTVLPNAPTVDIIATNQTTPAVTGSAVLAPDEVLSVEVDGQIYTMGDGNLSLSGANWTLTIPNGNALVEGNYEVVARVTDSIGNQNIDATGNELTVDLTPPAIPTVQSQTTNDPTPLIVGTATLGTGESLSVRVNGITYFDTGPELIASGGNWSLQIPLLREFTANGTYDVEAVVSDLAGNTTTDGTVGEFVFDTVLPDAPVVDPLATNNTTPAITGTANLAADEMLTVEVDGTSYAVGDGNLGLSGSAWTLVIPAGNALSEGVYEVVGVVTDSLGNRNSDATTNELTIDVTPPIVPTIDALTSNDPTPLLTGTATVGSDEQLVVRANGRTYFEVDPHLTVTGSNWSLQIPVGEEFTADGTYDIQATVTDAAGNVSTDATVGEFVFDTVLPDAPTVDALATNTTTPSITGTVNLLSGEFLSVQVDGVTYNQGADLTLSGGTWTLVVPNGNALAEGIYDVVALASDLSGNTNSDATVDELNIDLTPPLVPTVDVLATNDATPLITGTATVDPGDSFVVRVNGNDYPETGAHLTLAGTSWALQIPSIFQFTSPGDYEVQAVVTDPAGNATSDTTTLEFTFDNILPDAPTVDTLATNDTTPAITGTANLSAGDSLTVNVGGVTYSLGDGNLGMSGSAWTLVIPTANALSEGTFNVTATVTDSVGNANSDGTTAELVIDITPPATPTVDTLTSNDPTPLLTGTAILGSGETLNVVANGVVFVTSDPALTLAGNNWSLQIPVGNEYTVDGFYDIQATVTDLAGNTNSDISIDEFHYDTFPPNPPTVNSLVTNDITPLVTGTANLDLGETLSVSIDGVNYVPGDGNLVLSGSDWSLTIPVADTLAEGTYEVVAATRDVAGNVSSDGTTNELTIDITPPATPTVNLLTSNDPTPLLSGTAVMNPDESLTVTVNGTTYLELGGELVRAGSNWSLQIPVANQFTLDGTYDVVAVVTDLAGNSSSDVTLGEFTYDTALPNAPTVDPLETNDSTPVLSGTMNLAADESLSVTVNGIVYIPGDGHLTTSGNTWSLQIPAAEALGEGVYDVTATVVDSLGNASNDATTSELTIDQTPPARPTVTGQVTNDSTPTILGTATLGVGETLSVQVNGRTYVGGDGHLTISGPNWSLQIPVANEFTTDGSYDVVATATDAVGNASSDNTSGELVYDTALPNAPTVNSQTTNDPTPGITGTAILAADETLTVTVNGVVYTEASGHLTRTGSDWILLIPIGNELPEGTYEVAAVVTDAIGNANIDTTSDELVIDTTPPLTPSSNILVSNDATPLLTGTAIVGIDEVLTVSIQGRTYTLGDGNLTLVGNNWALQIPPGDAFTLDGIYDVEVAIEDAAGNRATDPTSGEFTYDTLPPGPPTVNLLTTNDVTPALTGAAILTNGETLLVDVNGQSYGLGGGQLTLSGSDWSLAIPAGDALPEGTYEVTARAVDQAGNTAIDLTTNELVIDFTPPVVPTVNQVTANDATPLLTGTAVLGTGEQLTVIFQGITYTVGDGNLTLVGNSWALQIPPGDAIPADGTYEVIAQVTDQAGNVSTDATTGEYTLDTALPDAPTVNSLETNSGTPAITGTASLAADELLSVSLNGVTYTQAGGNLTLVGNTWTLAVPVANALPEGVYDVSARVVDSLGNAATDNSIDELVIDQTPPATPTVNTLIDNDATPLLSGTANLGTGESLLVTANGQTFDVGSGHLSIAGTLWSLQIPAANAFPSDGVYDITATVTDEAGNATSDVTSGEFTFDTVLPQVPTVLPITTNNPTPNIAGTALLAGDEVLTVELDGTTYTLGDGHLTLLGNDWSLFVPASNALPEGIYDASAVVTDSLGNLSSDVTTNEVVIDLTPPDEPTVDALISNDRTPTFTGTVNLNPDEFLTVTVQGQSYSNGDGNLLVTGNTWSLQIPPGNAFTSDGVYDITATAHDTAGNSRNDVTSGEFTLDTTPPPSPSVDLLLTNDQTPTITGSVVLASGDRLEVDVNGRNYSQSGGQLTVTGSTWSLVIPPADLLPEGIYNVNAVAIDAVGNAASDATVDELEVDLTPPNVPTVNPLVSNDGTPLLTGTAALDPSDTLAVSFRGQTYVLGDGHLSMIGTNWLLQIPATNEVTLDDTYDVTATATDAAGNVAVDLTSGEFTLDSSLPDSAVVNFLSTNDTTPTITGTVNLAPGDTLTVTVDGQTYVPGDGNLDIVGNDWSLTIPSSRALAEGIYDVVAITTNALGSTNVDATSNELDVDLTPPAPPTVDILIDNEVAPLLSGTTIIEPGGQLQVTTNGRTYSEGDGQLIRLGTVWTLQVSPANGFTTDGTYDVVATSFDAAGNAANDITSGEYTRDTVPPAIPTVDNLRTNDVTPVISGSAAMLADERLTVSLNGVTYDQGEGNLTVTGSAWNLAIPFGDALGDGTYDVVATVIDSLGNHSSDTSLDELTIDLTPPPAPTVDFLIDNEPAPNLTGTALLIPGDNLQVNFGGANYTLGDGHLSISGTAWTLQVPAINGLLVDGVYDVVAIAADEFGNSQSDLTSGEYTLDTVLPASPTVNRLETNVVAPTLSGTSIQLADETLAVRVDGITYVEGDGNLSVLGAGVNKNWSLQIPAIDALAEGVYDVIATTTDSLGNAVADVTVDELVIDLTPPAFVPTVDSLVDNVATPVLTGSLNLAAGESFAVTANGRTYTPADVQLTINGATWSLQVPATDGFATDGSYDITATIRDLAGNVSVDTTSGEYTRDTVLPAVPSVDPLITNRVNPTLTGSATTLADESLTVIIDSVVYSVGDGNLSLAGTDWTLTLPSTQTLTEGIYEVTARITDSLGNTNTDSTTNELEVDLTSPATPTVTRSASNSPTPLISGTAILGPGEFLSVTAGGVTYLEGDGHLSINGTTWLLQIPLSNAFPSDGTYDIAATVIDSAGNSATDVTSGEFTLDSSLPDSATVDLLATNNTSPTLTGTANLAANESLTVEVDGTVYATGDGHLSFNGGAWTLTIPSSTPLSEGTYDVMARVTDSLGNVSVDATSAELSIDLTAPATPTVNVVETNSVTPTITGTANPLPGEQLSVLFDGVLYNDGDGHLSLQANGDWTLLVPAVHSLTTDGLYDVVATLTDVAGNASTDTTMDEVLLDRQPPARPTVDALITNDVTPTLSGSVSVAPSDTFQVSVQGQGYQVGDGNLSIVGGTWNLLVPASDALGEGVYQVVATATDALGNAISDTTLDDLTIDLTPPSAPTVDPIATNDSTPLITGTAAVGPGEFLTVTVNGRTYQAGDGNLALTGPTWSLQIPVVDAFTVGGPQEVVATVTDAAGNATSDGTNDEIELRITPPARPTIQTLTTTTTTPQISGTATLAVGDNLSIELDGTVYTPGDGNLVSNGTSWTLQVPIANELALGNYDVVAMVTDGFGNVAVDVTMDELTIEAAPSGPTFAFDSINNFSRPASENKETTKVLHTLTEEQIRLGSAMRLLTRFDQTEFPSIEFNPGSPSLLETRRTHYGGDQYQNGLTSLQLFLVNDLIASKSWRMEVPMFEIGAGEWERRFHPSVRTQSYFFQISSVEEVSRPMTLLELHSLNTMPQQLNTARR